MSPRRRTQALNRRRRVSRISLSLQECDGVACSMHRGAIVMKHNNRLQTTAYVWQWPPSKKVVATVCPLNFDTKSEHDCNKSSVP